MTGVDTQKVPGPGDTAPDFTLRTTSGDSVTLSSFRGKRNVLLAFFPLAFTGTCTGELCDFSRDELDFAAAGIEVVPISVDAVPSLQAFREKESITLHLASDFHRGVSRAYGVLDEVKGYSRRSYFLVDREGIVRWSHVEEHNGLRRSNGELLAEIARLG